MSVFDRPFDLQAFVIAAGAVSLLVLSGLRGRKIGKIYSVRSLDAAFLLGFLLGPVGWYLVRRALPKASPPAADPNSIQEARARAFAHMARVAKRANLAEMEAGDDGQAEVEKK